jgi:hypothetical protein
LFVCFSAVRFTDFVEFLDIAALVWVVLHRQAAVAAADNNSSDSAAAQRALWRSYGALS